MPYNLFVSGKFDSLNPYMIFAVTDALIAALGRPFHFRCQRQFA